MAARGAAPASSTLQTADRALAILQEFVEPGGPLTVSELARRLHLHRSTVSRLVSTLEARGFVERTAPGELLRLGPEIVRLGRAATTGSTLIAAALPVMDELAERTGETITLALPARTQVVTVAQSHGRHFVSSGNWVGVQAPPHCCSDGKVLLAYDALTLAPGRLPRLTARTITARRALEAELADVRRRGYAIADGELEEGLVGLAVPVLDAGTCLAALCISGPGYRLHGEAVAGYAPVCTEAAARITG